MTVRGKKLKVVREKYTMGYEVFKAYRNLLYCVESFNKTGSIPCDVLVDACERIHKENRKWLGIKESK